MDRWTSGWRDVLIDGWVDVPVGREMSVGWVDRWTREMSSRVGGWIDNLTLKHNTAL